MNEPVDGHPLHRGRPWLNQVVDGDGMPETDVLPSPTARGSATPSRSTGGPSDPGISISATASAGPSSPASLTRLFRVGHGKQHRSRREREAAVPGPEIRQNPEVGAAYDQGGRGLIDVDRDAVEPGVAEAWLGPSKGDQPAVPVE